MGPPPDHTPPMVAVTSPVNGGSIQAGNQVSFTANASDASGIASVQFLDGTTSLGVDTTAPYGVTWNTTGLSGSHTLKALATDGSNQANTAFSTVTVTITVPPPICTTLQASTITWTGTGIAFNPPQTVTICP
jgi:chitinase